MSPAAWGVECWMRTWWWWWWMRWSWWWRLWSRRRRRGPRETAEGPGPRGRAYDAGSRCILPRNHTNCFGCPLSVAPNTPCTGAPSGHSGCMAARSAGVKNGHARAFGFGCGWGGCGAGAAFGSRLGCLARRAEVSAPPGPGLGLGQDCSGAGLGASFDALRLNMLYAGPCSSCGR